MVSGLDPCVEGSGFLEPCKGDLPQVQASVKQLTGCRSTSRQTVIRHGLEAEGPGDSRALRQGHSIRGRRRAGPCRAGRRRPSASIPVPRECWASRGELAANHKKCTGPSRMASSSAVPSKEKPGAAAGRLAVLATPSAASLKAQPVWEATFSQSIRVPQCVASWSKLTAAADTLSSGAWWALPKQTSMAD